MANKNFKLILKEHLSSSTIHGLSKIDKSSTIFTRVMWIIFFLIAIAFCSFMVIKNITNFLKYETTTKIETKYEISPVFPSVTVCNVNFFTSDYAIEYFTNRSNIYSNPLKKHQLSINEIYSNPDYHKNIDKFGDHFEKLFISCLFNSKSCDNASFWKFYNSHLFGNCFQFNTDSKDLLTNSIPGFSNGLQIVLNVSVPRELSHLNHRRGAVVFIHNHTEIPSNFLMAPVGFETFISVSRVFIKKIKKPYTDCDGDTDNPDAFDSEIFKFIHSKGFKYSQRFCMSVCLQKFLLERCNCLSSFYPLIEQNVQVCSNFIHLIECARSNRYEFSSNSEISGSCLAMCPLECESSRLEKTYSMVDFLNQEWEEIVQHFFNETGLEERKLKEEILSINIFYEDLDYTLISERESFNLISLISNLGGIAGLFLGASFLSLLEFVELFVNFIILWTKKLSKGDKIVEIKKKNQNFG
ncbi:acid-sensing ion channel 4 [Brachionus plicatilis]|uniref:Acid-sensing ion channel 4 n=1 Tax=Brachionus plicatilis TaxID=10195 RepID=A0A3M7RMP3_BRAPC|nr:acid-sensing ion channel 4 [Brachionus plicatilis]